MKPLYIKKNGQVEKVTGAFAMPASYPAERVAYDNTDSGLSADDAQGAIDEIVEEVNDKVDKVNGKELSTNDYTTAEKNKLEGISANANKVESSTTNGNIKIDSVETPVYRNYGNNTVLTTDKTPFLTRQTLNPTGFSGYVREKLIGASYAWNQLVQNGNFASTDGWSTYQATISVSNNVCTMVRAVASGSNSMYRVVTKQPNHKYLWSLKVKNNVGSNSIMVQWFKSGTSGSTTSLLANTGISNSYTTYSGIIATDNSDADGALIIFLTTVTVNNSIDIKEVQITDLTLAFGSTIADHLYSLTNNAAITKLRDMGCPIDKYTPYGNYLVSSQISGKKIVGKNLFDFKTALNYWGASYTDNGDDTYTITDIGTAYTNAFLIAPYPINISLSAYSITNLTGSTNWQIGIYDENEQTWKSLTTSTLSRTNYGNKIRLNYSQVGSGGVFKHVQMELGTRVTEYEPYSSTTYSLGNDELRGKFDLVDGEIVANGDVKESNGNINRVMTEVDLGSLTWQYSSGGFFYANDLPYATVKNTLNCICEKYVRTRDQNGQSITTEDKTFAVFPLYWFDDTKTKSVVIRDTSYGSDYSAFKTAMSGVYLIYELATPTTEQSTPFADPMSLVGATTEEYIDTRDIPCPVGAERQYMGQSEDVVEIPSSPMADGKRVLISEVSGGKEQVYWDIPTLYYKEYTVQGDGTKTYGDLLAELKPYYEALSEDEKTYSKVMMRATSSGNECLTFVGNYWYSRMGVNASGLWLDQIDFQYNKYFKQVGGDSITDYTNTNAGTNVFALRVLTYTRAES